jgi:NAD(P)-dependent dehydrogenase (short-subunit alcohol dehydrogenase family)
MTLLLEGRVALLTGGAMGIGNAMLKRLVHDGAAVVTIDKAQEELAAACAELIADGHRVLPLVGDVTVEDDVTSAVEAAVRTFGKLDAVVNNVGWGIELSVDQTSPAQWHQVLDTCLTSTYLVCRAAIPALRAAGGGAIVNVSSIQGQRGYPRFAAYSSAKGAIIALTQQMAGDYGGEAIRVNVLCPGSVMTPGARVWLDEQPDQEATLRDMSRWPALKRLAEPHEIAAAAAWLLSNEASYVTGHALVVDGGAIARGFDAAPPEPA